MIKKFLNLFNVKSWLETFVLKFMASKGVKHAATTLAGIAAGLATKYQLDKYGVTIDVPLLTESLMTAFGALFGALINWAIQVMDKDGDGRIG